MKKSASLVRNATSVGRQAQGSGGAAGADAARLRQQLVHARAEIGDLQEELQEKNNLYLNAIKERDAGAERLNNAKESLNRFEALVKQQVDRATDKERKQHETVRAEKDRLEARLKLVEAERDDARANYERERQANATHRPGQDGQRDGFFSGGTDLKDNLAGAAARSAIEKKDRELAELKRHINDLQDRIEDFMAENKVLRDMAGVPANYGIDREKVKLMDREKIDDFKKLIRVLQEDNYRLEEERAKLKHRLRQAAMTRQDQAMQYIAAERHKTCDLTPAQVARVDEFVWALVDGGASEPADLRARGGLGAESYERLKSEMEALNAQGFDAIKGQLEGLFKDVAGQGAGGFTPEQFNVLHEKIRADNEELKALLQGRIAAAGSTGAPLGSGRGDHHAATLARSSTTGLPGFGATAPFHARMQPPVPRVNADQSITHGYSHKFGVDLAVTGKNGEERGIDVHDAYDNAFLQVQLQECFELIGRKDEALKAQKREIETLYGRIKKYLHMQDHLYKDHVAMESTHTKVVDDLKVAARNANEAFAAEQTKVKKLEALVQNLEKGVSTDDQKGRLVELTKQNSLLEVNLIRMTRKYQALEEQERLLRRNYQNVEQEMSEMEVGCLQRINQLKEWKRNATFQLKQLYEQLRVAVPLPEYERVSKELEIYKQKNGDLQVRNREYAARVSGLQAEVRQVSDAVDAQRELQAYKDDLEQEFHQVRVRLEGLDPQYRWENQLYHKIVETLKRSRVSVTQAFELFDEDGDGQLARGEFVSALGRLGLGELSGQEVDLLMRSIDTDRDGRVQYKEFTRKLQRCGLKSLSAEEMLVFNIVKTLRRLNMSQSDLFKFLNKDGGGLVTRQDFRDTLGTLKMKEVSEADITRFIDYFYKDEKGGIDLRSFL
jgi:Ca2+-binding EF-hand superfamily protein